MRWLESSTQEHGLDLTDFIGVESCIDLQADINIESYPQCDGGIKKRDKQWGMINEKEYPPPIPWLASTTNLPYSRMPWVMKRYYTEDGRLIIKEEKVKRYEYFEARRSNGRLTLHLVPLNDEVSSTHDDSDQEEFVKEEEVDVNRRVEDGNIQQRNGKILKGEQELAYVNGGAVIGGGGSKCYSSCMFGLPMPSIRPVHT